MALPKRKTSKARRDRRRAHDSLKVKSLGECKDCGSVKLPHHVCNTCGRYKSVQVISVK